MKALLPALAGFFLLACPGWGHACGFPGPGTPGSHPARDGVQPAAAVEPPDSAGPPAAKGGPEQAAIIVSKYVREKYGWNKEAYALDFHAGGGSSSVLAVLVRHREDRKPARPGGGTSMLLYVDMEKRAVIRELHFQ